MLAIQLRKYKHEAREKLLEKGPNVSPDEARAVIEEYREREAQLKKQKESHKNKHQADLTDRLQRRPKQAKLEQVF